MIRRIITSLGLIISVNAFATSVDEGVTLFNQMQYKQAQAVFEPLAKQGNARAMLWLGVSQFKTGEQFKAGSTLLQAAEAGNPWAMHLMVPSYNGHCGYLGWPCDEDWMKKAITGWEKLADSGDGNAMYALLRWRKSWWKYIPILNKNKNGELAKLAVKSGGYKAANFHVDIPLSIDKRIKLLKYAASKNYAPAMLYLYLASQDEKYIDVDIDEVKLLKNVLFLGFGGQALIFYYEKMIPDITKIADLKNLSTEEHRLLADLYYYSLINQEITGELDFKPFKWVYGEQREGEKIELFSSEEKKKIEERARKFLINFKPNLFLDEASSVHALLGS